MSHSTPWVVIKFGGTSVSSRANWEMIAKIVRERLAEGLRPLVVCSALAGVSDSLERLMAEAPTGDHPAVLDKIKEKHLALAQDLGVDGAALLTPYFKELSRIAVGAKLVREVSPRLHARALAFGEIMSTQLGAAFLNAQGLVTTWHDARESLIAEDNPRLTLRQQYLSAACCYSLDGLLLAVLNGYETPVVLTQGFIATNREGETVLLGRGGSDTSAAYFAAKLNAQRCEIWTDVAGVFSADPRQVPTARLLMRLGYEEAQEITSMGAKVLHPRCLGPLVEKQIPIHIRCTSRPELQGTIITADVPLGSSQVKAISSKYNITLISMETLGMWQQVGFLADVFACFKKHGLSIDLVSTSQTNVTVSLDPIANALNADTLNALTRDLQEFCSVRQISPCATVSLVGRNIRKLLPELGPTLSVFGNSQIHLVSQAANDLNISFVVEEGQAARLVDQLHQLLFEHHRHETLLGPTWSEIFAEKAEPRGATDGAWWLDRRTELLELAAKESPLYVYSEEMLAEAVDQMKTLKAVDRVFYSLKANPFPPILSLFYESGLGFECVSPGEVELILSLFPDIDRRRILFTPNFAPRFEYARTLEQGVIVTLDNLYPLQAWPDLFRKREVFVRVDPGRGRGHHDHVKTAGSHSKFGISRDQISELIRLAKKNKTRIVGLHAHTGSGILTPENWRETAAFLAQVADEIPDVRVLDVGGGLGVVEKPGQLALDLLKVNEGLAEVKSGNAALELWLEPGRYLVAHAGVLLSKVTQTKQKDDFHYVGIETGMNSLIRPALYGAYHEIYNLSAERESERVKVNIVGPICESGDVLGHDRDLAPAKEGHVLLIATVGAYGHAMSSNYNLRAPAQEVLLPKRDRI